MVRLIVEYDGILGNKMLCQKKWYAMISDSVKKVLPQLTSFPITIILVDDERIKTLNQGYRAHHRVTDVLSFLYEEQEGKEGELFISIPVAKRQSVRYGVSLSEEIARLVIHGMLHLYGYDHMKTGERKVMRGLEKHALINAHAAKLW